MARDGYAGPVALVDDVAFVGVPGREGGAAGEVLVFTRVEDTWSLTQRIGSPAGTSSLGNFGASVAVLDDTLVVGAPALREGAVQRGAAYLFELVGSTWTESPSALTRPGDLVGFGASIAISESWVVVGAPSNDSFTVPGAVVIFDRTGAEGPVVLSAATDGTSLGASVAVAGEVVLAGEPGAGSVTAFDHASAWSPTTLVQPGGLGVEAAFGSSVAVVGVGETLRALVGAPLATSETGTVGGVFAFDRVGGVWPAIGGTTIVFEGLAQSDALGTAIAIDASGETAVVGAPFAGVDDAGRAHVLWRDGSAWRPLGALRVGSPSAGEQLGAFVAIDDDTILAGAPNAALEGARGYVAVFAVPSSPGAPCASDVACGSGHCVDEVCCVSECTGECSACDATGTCVADDRATSCTTACGVAGSAGVCQAGNCAPSEGVCPDSGVPLAIDDGGLVGDAGPRRRVSGCRCRVGDSDARGLWVACLVVGAAFGRGVRTSRGKRR